MDDADRQYADPFHEPHACARPAGECCSDLGDSENEDHGCATCPEGRGRPPALLWPLLLVLLLGFAAVMARILS